VRINKFSDHLLVLPEDDANRQIANGFLLAARVDAQKIQVMPNAGGWLKALDKISSHSNEMEGLTTRRLLVLIDFDSQYEDRWQIAQSKIPTKFLDRIYVIGVASNPEKLRSNCGLTSEALGKALAEECAEEKFVLWSNALLAHNARELKRLSADVKSFVFYCET
jgi:hypothetical protein